MDTAISRVDREAVKIKRRRRMVWGDAATGEGGLIASQMRVQIGGGPVAHSRRGAGGRGLMMSQIRWITEPAIRLPDYNNDAPEGIGSGCR